MKKTIKALRGMADILPDQVEKWQYVENAARIIFYQYGYKEIRTPVIEETALFKRTIGEETDIVQKQMYSFMDRGERDITLRPEGTASIVRAYLENNLGNNSPVCRLYYIGPMFRSERPQAGRNRQFYQIGVEAIGSASPYLDAELIYLMMKLLEVTGLNDAGLKINNLGCDNDKKKFEEILKKALAGHVSRLCPDCAKRYNKNVLRIFDCKNESCKLLLRTAPTIIEHICPDCKSSFDRTKTALESVGVRFSVDPLLVRGLDYYTGTVFEATHKNLGSQDAVAAGGRYDNLVAEIGGRPTPACGFAIGLDRVLIAAGDRIKLQEKRPEIFLILLGEEAQLRGFKILRELREKGIYCQMAFEGTSLKSQMRLADRVNAKKVLIIGDEELKKDAAIIRDMDKKEQKEISLNDATNAHMW